LGRQPHQVRVVLATGPSGQHQEGTPVHFEMQVRGDRVTCLANGTEILRASNKTLVVGSSG